MTNDDTAQVTMKDFRNLRDEIVDLVLALDQKWLQRHQSFRKEMRTEMKGHVDMFSDWFTQLSDKIENTKEEMKAYTDKRLEETKKDIINGTGVLIEELKSDFMGFSKDKLTLHDQQIRELQVHVGIR